MGEAFVGETLTLGCGRYMSVLAGSILSAQNQRGHGMKEDVLPQATCWTLK